MRILLIEDDEEICEAVKAQLIKEGYAVDICCHGQDAVYYISNESYDAVVMDRLLPGVDGLTLVQLMRQKNIKTPVIMATAMGSVSDRIDGLDSGADDYIIKPYDIQELTARLRALTRRPAAIGDSALLSYADLIYNRNERELACGDNQFRLSKREGLLAEFFLQNPEKTLTRELIFSHVWGMDTEVENGNLDNYIHFIRKRLKALRSKTEIRTIHNFGYRLQETGPQQKG